MWRTQAKKMAMATIGSQFAKHQVAGNNTQHFLRTSASVDQFPQLAQ